MPSSASDRELLGRQAALQAEAGQVLAQLDLDQHLAPAAELPRPAIRGLRSGGVLVRAAAVWPTT